MHISDRGLDLIKNFEGLRLEAYPDPGTGGIPWTIGVGHTGPEVVPGLVIDEAKALELLRQDCSTAERCILRNVKVRVTQDQFDALVSFIFNVGCQAFFTSTMCRLLNAGDYAGAKDQFKRWDRAAGKQLAGLTKRRAAEAELFWA